MLQPEPFLHVANWDGERGCQSGLVSISENKNYGSTIYIKIKFYHDDLPSGLP